MSKSIVKNYIYNVSYQLLIMIVPLITAPYLARVLGADKVGTFDYTQSIVNYFVLFSCIGMNIYGQREVAYCQNDPQKRSRIFWGLVLLRVITVSVSLIIYYFFIVRNSEYYQYFMIFIVEIVASIFDISWFFQGTENFRVVAIRNFIIKILGVILIFLLVKNKEQLNIYIWCYAGTILLGNLTLWFHLPGRIQRISWKELHLFRHFLPALSLFVPQIAISVYTQLDKTMIGLLSTNAQVGYYSQADKITKVSLTIVTSLGAVMLSRVAHTYAQNDREKMKDYITKSFQFVFFLSVPIMFGLAGISRGFVPWFFGEGWDPAIRVMMILCPIVLLIGLSNVMSYQYLLPTKQVKYYTIAVVSGACTNFLFNLLLIPHFGSAGASVATVMAEFAVTAIEFYFIRSVFRLSNFHYIWKNLLAGVVVLAVSLALTFVLPVSILSTLLEIAAGGIVYIVLLFIMRDAFLLSSVQQVKSKLASRKKH